MSNLFSCLWIAVRVKSTEFFPNRCSRDTLFFLHQPMEILLGKLLKNNAIAHCSKLYTENLHLDPVSGEVWIVAGWVGMGVHHVWDLGGGRMEGWKDGCSNNQRPGALASLEAG